MEIADMFDASGVCYLEIKDGDKILYLTVTKENGMAVSTRAYVQPWEFRTVKEP